MQRERSCREADANTASDIMQKTKKCKKMSHRTNNGKRSRKLSVPVSVSSESIKNSDTTLRGSGAAEPKGMSERLKDHGASN